MQEGLTVWEKFRQFQERGSFKLIANTPDTVVIRVENQTGEGDMIVYRVFDGIFLMYNDFHMAYYNSTFQAAQTVLAVDYCREGSLTMKCENGYYQVKKAGSVTVDSRVHHKGLATFPTNHFHGITVGFESKLAQETLQKGVSSIPIDLEAIRDKYCGDEGFFIISKEETLTRIFTDLYHVPQNAKLAWFKAKVVELLICLASMEPDTMAKEQPYFYKDQVEKTHEAARILTRDLREDHTIQDLAQILDISSSALKTCFKGIYGQPVHTWLTNQRIQKACELLLEQPQMSIANIAYEVGYENAGKFSAVFKRLQHMTPKEYRSQSH